MPIDANQSSELQTILTTAGIKRDQVRRSVVAELVKLFPVDSTQYRIEATNFRVEPNNYSANVQKMALLEAKTLTEPVKADLVLIDKKTGATLDKRAGFTLLQLPWMTPRHTFTIDGHEYSVANQPRIRPGVYTRTRSNEEIESAFNLSKGKNFRLSLQPETGKFFLEIESSKIPLYAVLKIFGATDADIAGAWGKELADSNASSFGGQTDRALTSLYEKFIPFPKTGIGAQEKLETVKTYFADTRMDAEVTGLTLGTNFDRVNKDALLVSSSKLLKVYKGESQQDDRDSLEFKAMHSVDDHLAERIRLKGKEITNKIKFKMNFSKGLTKISTFVPTGAFTKTLRSFITTASLSSQPTQINPVEIIDYAAKVTPLGEGGIENERAVPNEAREVHPTYFGFLDPVHTPESSHAGIDLRAAMLLAKDKDGRMYTPMYDVKNGKNVYVSTADIRKSVIAFPMQGVRALSKLSDEEKNREVDVLINGKVSKKPVKEVDFYLEHPARMYSTNTNLVPVADGDQANRLLMASKHVNQALPLVDAEVPLVQTQSYIPGKSHEQLMADMVNPISPVDGEVVKVTDEFIVIKDSSGKEHDVQFYTHFPLASKTYLHDTVKVKVGDKVKTGDHLGDSIFTRNNTLAMGKNLNVAFLAYNGLNSNDAVVISEAAAKKLTSLHMYKLSIPVDTDVYLKKNLYMAHYPAKYTRDQLNKLGDDGVIAKGSKLETGDPWVVALRETQPSQEDIMLGRLHKGLIRKYRDEADEWHKDTPGEVIDVVKTPHKVTITVRTEAPMGVGDKMVGRHGNKGVVARILPDDQMPQRADGTPLDVLYTSATVVSRINPGQIVETAIAKAMQKQGKTYVFNNFAPQNNVKLARKMLEEAGVKDKEKVYDPMSGKWIDNVMVGPQYFFKLFKSTDTNFSARDVGGYDPNEQPGKGGEEGSKALGGMEVNALIAHNARNILREAATIKSQKNAEFWRAVQLGLPIPPIKTTFAYNKFNSMLMGSGLKVNKKGSQVSVSPMTDKDVLAMSHGAIENPKMVRAKDLAPERGGMFDEVITGGTRGERWSHINLNEPIVSPMFEESARRLLGMSTKDFAEAAYSDPSKLKADLNALDLDAEEKKLRSSIPKLKALQKDDAIKRVKYIRALKEVGLKPGDAYMISKVPVMPPVMRPVTPSKIGDLMIDDPNYLYRDLMLANESLRDVKDAMMPQSDVKAAREHLFESMKSVVGLSDPISPQLQAKNVKGFVKNIAGTTPKTGFFQSKLVSKPQDVTGRGTAAPDPGLGFDDIGLPEEMAWKMYSAYIIRRLTRSGYTAARAKEMVDERAYPAKVALEAELKERPVLYNRAPSLWRYSIVAAYPKLVEGKTIKVNPLVESGMNLDYDGDALQVHLPVTEGGIADAKKMTLSNLIFSDKYRNDLQAFPQHEAIIGLYQASSAVPTGKKAEFNNLAEAWNAYKAGKLQLGDEVKILGTSLTRV